MLSLAIEIKQNEEKLLSAFQNCDLEVIANLLHEKALFVYPNGLLLTKSNVLDNYRSGNSAFNSIKVSEQEINIIENTAVVAMVLD